MNEAPPGEGGALRNSVSSVNGHHPCTHSPSPPQDFPPHVSADGCNRPQLATLIATRADCFAAIRHHGAVAMTDSTPRLGVYDGRTYCGFILRRAEAAEAFTADEQSIGTFKNEQVAALQIWRRARGQT
jgi:hypothetical protein